MGNSTQYSVMTYMGKESKKKVNICICMGLPWSLRWQRIYLQCRRPRFDPRMGKSPDEGNGNPLQYSCLENSMDKGAWWVIIHEVTKSQT